MTLDVAVVAPLPPAPTGVAGYVADQLTEWARRAAVTAYVEEGQRAPAGVATRPSSELGAHDHDVIVFHVGNSVANLPAVRAAATGPPGVVWLHDGTLHHLIEAAGTPEEVEAELVAAHGEAGRRIAAARRAGARGRIELGVFDCLGPLLARHRAAITHSAWTAGLVRRRAPRLPVSVIPHPVPSITVDPPGGALPAGPFWIGHVGWLTDSKRPDVLVAAVDRLLAEGHDVGLAVLGLDATAGGFASLLERHPRVAERAVATGWLPDAELARATADLGCLLTLRSPQLGESSGSVALAMAVGTPVVTQRVGAFAEVPAGAVEWADVGGDEIAHVATAVGRLVAEDAAERTARRRRVLDAGQTLDPAALADRAVEVLAGIPAPDGSAAPVIGPVLSGGGSRPRVAAAASPPTVHLADGAGAVHTIGEGRRPGPRGPAGTVLLVTGTAPSPMVVTTSGVERYGAGPWPPIAGSVVSPDVAVSAHDGVHLIAGGVRHAPGGDRSTVPDGTIDVIEDTSGGWWYLTGDRVIGPAGTHSPRGAAPIALAVLDGEVIVVHADGAVSTPDGSVVEPFIPRSGPFVAATGAPSGAGVWLVTACGEVFGVRQAPWPGGLTSAPAEPVVRLFCVGGSSST